MGFNVSLQHISSQVALLEHTKPETYEEQTDANKKMLTIVNETFTLQKTFRESYSTEDQSAMQSLLDRISLVCVHLDNSPLMIKLRESSNLLNKYGVPNLPSS